MRKSSEIGLVMVLLLLIVFGLADVKLFFFGGVEKQQDQNIGLVDYCGSRGNL